MADRSEAQWREELEMAIAANDVPSVANVASEVRAARSSLRERANEALAQRLQRDVEQAEKTEIGLPEDYPRFADELQRDDPRFAELARRTRDVYEARRGTAMPPQAGLAGDNPNDEGEEGD